MLPEELQATVREVEQVAGCEIAVVPDAAASEFDSLTFGIEAGVCRATIAYHGDSISRCAILHELLHLKRYWLDAVPILRPTAEAESNAHWSAGLAESPRISSASSQAKVVTLQRNLMLQRALMDIALPDLDHTSLYDRLRDENFLEASTAFVDRLREMLNDKKCALIFASREFRYDLTGFCVGCFNLRANPKSFERSVALIHYS